MNSGYDPLVLAEQNTQQLEKQELDQLGTDERNHRPRKRGRTGCLGVNRGSLIKVNTALLTLFTTCSCTRPEDLAADRAAGGLARTRRKEHYP